MIDKKLKKELREYVKENLAKGYSISAIKKALTKYGYDEEFTNYLIKNRKRREEIAIYASTISIILLFVLTLFVIQPAKIGLVTLNKEFSYSDNVNLTIKDSYEYDWLVGNKGILTSLKLTGSISKGGYAKVYLEHEKESYLIFDSDRLSEEGISKITGKVISEEDESVENNESSSDKLIEANIEGSGIKDISDVFEFNINAKFNWDVPYDKLCTKWVINDYSLCYGSNDCCNLIGLESLGDVRREAAELAKAELISKMMKEEPSKVANRNDLQTSPDKLSGPEKLGWEITSITPPVKLQYPGGYFTDPLNQEVVYEQKLSGYNEDGSQAVNMQRVTEKLVTDDKGYTYRKKIIRIFGAGYWRQGKAIYEKNKGKIHS